MTTPTRNLGPLLVVIGGAFAALNVTELLFLDGGWPQVVGLAFGAVLAGVGLARWRGASGVAPDA